MTLSAKHFARRRRANKLAKINRLSARLDKYVATGEAMKRGTKGRAYWLGKAERTRMQLKAIEH